MARSFLSIPFALTSVTLILFGAGALPVTAQPANEAPASAAPKTKTYPELQAAFSQFVQDRDRPACIKALESVSRKYPELPSPHVLMYKFLSLPQVNQANPARAELEKAVKANPSDPEPWILFGKIAVQEQRLAEATADFDKAKQLLAAYRNTERKIDLETLLMSGLAQAAEKREDWKDAEHRFRDLLKRTPKDLDAYRRLAHVLCSQGKTAEAYDLLKTAKQIDRENAKKNGTREVMPPPEDIITNKAEGAWPESADSEKLFRRALDSDPYNLATRQVVAIWALKNGKIDLLKEQADAALRIEAADAAQPPDKRMYSGSNVGRMFSGLVALWEKDWPRAETEFQKVIVESPNDFGARNNLALALVEQDDPQKKQKALAYAEANYRENNRSPDALATLGWVYFRRNEFDQAGLALEQALKATKGQLNNSDTATYVAHILYHQGRKYQAKQTLDGILKSERPFSMRPEAQKLYEKVKDAKKPEAAPAENTP